MILAEYQDLINERQAGLSETGDYINSQRHYNDEVSLLRFYSDQINILKDEIRAQGDIPDLRNDDQ